MGRNTTPMGISNIAFLLERLGHDCSPLQFVRELTQNSIEAIQKLDNPTGSIEWGYDLATFEATGKRKLCITDTGCGMTAGEMIQHINNLSDSGGIQSLVDNFGVGAKIAAATQSPEGLIYLSWTREDRDGAMIHLWKDQNEGTYGLRRFNGSDKTAEFIEIRDDVKPGLIQSHGTRVIVLGRSEDDETFLPPPSVTSKDRWLLKYLNTRYFKIPEGITIRCQDLHTFKKRFRTVTGQGPFLDEKSVSKGLVNIGDAVVYWWILPDRKEDPASLQTEGPSYEVNGHVAALYQGELYEMQAGKSGRSALQQFGIVFGTSRVVLYVEPNTENISGSISANTPRTALLIDRNPLPWESWAEKFREKLPREIKQMMDEIVSKEQNRDNEKSIRDRLKPLMHLFQVNRYRICDEGEFEADDSMADGVEKPSSTRSSNNGHTARPKPTKLGAGGIYRKFQKPDGSKASKSNPDPFPKVTWVSVKDGTREVGQMEDRAASFNMVTNDLLINADFRVFNTMVEQWDDAYTKAGIVGSRAYAINSVQMWFEQMLVEAVIGIQALKDSKEWDYKQLQASLSEEALTMVVMPRYFVNVAVKRELGSKLGKVPGDVD